MSFKDYKKGLTPIEDQAIENSRSINIGRECPLYTQKRTFVPVRPMSALRQ